MGSALTNEEFDEFIQCAELCNDTLYLNPPKVSLEAVIKQWKIRE